MNSCDINTVSSIVPLPFLFTFITRSTWKQPDNKNKRKITSPKNKSGKPKESESGGESERDSGNAKINNNKESGVNERKKGTRAKTKYRVDCGR